MNQAASHPAGGRELQETTQNGRLLSAEGGGIWKERITASAFGGRERSVRQMTSVVLTRKLQTERLRVHAW